MLQLHQARGCAERGQHLWEIVVWAAWGTFEGAPTAAAAAALLHIDDHVVHEGTGTCPFGALALWTYIIPWGPASPYMSRTTVSAPLLAAAAGAGMGHAGAREGHGGVTSNREQQLHHCNHACHVAEHDRHAVAPVRYTRGTGGRGPFDRLQQQGDPVCAVRVCGAGIRGMYPGVSYAVCKMRCMVSWLHKACIKGKSRGLAGEQ